jgi:integrase
VIDAARHLLSTDYPGESVVAVPERLGHEDATLVLTTYGHLMPDSENRTRRAVDEARRAPSAPQDDEGAL